MKYDKNTSFVSAINVDGMSCQHCVNTIYEAVAKLNGLYSVKVELENKRVIVDYDPERVSIDTIKATIEDQGYNVK